MNINLTIFVILFCLMSVFGIVLAWSEPVNFDGKIPLNSSNHPQAKSGDLGVYTLYDMDNNDYFLNLNGFLSAKLNGGFILKDSDLTCSEEIEGAIKFSKIENTLYLCDGVDWGIYYKVDLIK